MRADKHAEQRRLAGSVRADDADRLAGATAKSTSSSTRSAPKVLLTPAASRSGRLARMPVIAAAPSFSR